MNIRKTTAARGFAQMIGEATTAMKRPVILLVRSYGPSFTRRVETYVWEYVRDQTYTRAARN
jgi:hypothetical protein